MEFQDCTRVIIGCAIEVHRHLGPGLLESAYRECLTHELRSRDLMVEREVPLPVAYKQIRLEAGYRMDLVVERSVVVELKAVDTLLPVHQAQLLTYLRFSGKLIGLLINFNVPSLRLGIKRLVF